MLTAPEAIEQLIEAGTHRVDHHNAQPWTEKITLADTLEAKAAELICHLARQEQYRLLVECRLSDQISDAQWQEHMKDSRFAGYVALETARRAEPAPAPLTAAVIADALDAFWNAAIGASRQNQADFSSTSTICSMAAGFAAVAQQLREGAR